MSILSAALQAMRDTNHFVRENITQCLGNYEEQSRIVCPVLEKCFQRSSAEQPIPRRAIVEARLNPGGGGQGSSRGDINSEPDQRRFDRVRQRRAGAQRDERGTPNGRCLKSTKC